jgi:hypothetical protein
MNVPTLGFQSNEQYLINLDQNLVRAREIARANMKNAALRNKYYFDKNRRDVSYNVGDFVMIHYPTRIVGKSEKLLHNFRGPFEVIECSPNGVNYKVRGLGKRNKVIIDKVHVSRMKGYYDRDKMIDRLENADESSDLSSTEFESENIFEIFS